MKILKESYENFCKINYEIKTAKEMLESFVISNPIFKNNINIINSYAEEYDQKTRHRKEIYKKYLQPKNFKEAYEIAIGDNLIILIIFLSSVLV